MESALIHDIKIRSTPTYLSILQVHHFQKINISIIVFKLSQKQN